MQPVLRDIICTVAAGRLLGSTRMLVMGLRGENKVWKWGLAPHSFPQWPPPWRLHVLVHSFQWRSTMPVSCMVCGFLFLVHRLQNLYHWCQFWFHHFKNWWGDLLASAFFHHGSAVWLLPCADTEMPHPGCDAPAPTCTGISSADLSR